ncbi:MAG: CoA-binding protein [Kofleriaceae bacterium]
MPTIDEVRNILKSSPTVAVLGIHSEPQKPAYYVPEYLYDEGYRILGVNPELVGETLFGEPVRATLAEIAEPIDLVDVFRRGEVIPEHLEDILAMKPPPRVVWFQLGITNNDAAQALEAAGIKVVQNRCTLADHQRLALGAPERNGVSKLRHSAQ